MSVPTTPFGRPTSSALAPQSEFGQANNANNSPFVVTSFGGTTPFGSPAGGSAYRGTSTGVFGGGSTRTPSPFSSEAAFGASSSSAFGAFGRLTSSALAPQSEFRQANNANNNSPFVVTSFGGTTPFGSPAGGSVSGGTSTGVFGGGSTRTPSPYSSEAAVGAFASSAGVCKRTSEGGGFGLSTPAFRTTSTPAFVTDSAPSFGATRTPSFGTSGNAFGPAKGPIFGSGGAFGASSNSDFGASCCSSLSFGSSQAFGPSTTAFRGSQIGSESRGAHTGSQVATRTFGGTEFGNSSFGGQHRGSRVAPFTPTTEAEPGEMLPFKLQSICSMTVPAYKCKSQEELRWEDYQRGDKGGPNHAGQSGVSVDPSASPAIPWPTFSQSSPFPSTTASNAFSSAPASAVTSSPISFTSSNELSITAPSPFVLKPSSNAGFWPSPNTSPFGCSSSLTSVVRSQPSAFEFSAPPSTWSSSVSATLGSSPPVISAPTTQSSPLLWSTNPPIAKSASAFRQAPTSFSQTTAPFGQITTPTFAQMCAFSTASSGSGGSLFPSTSLPVLSTNAAAISQTHPSCSLPFQTSEAAETSRVSSLGNLGQTQAAGTGGFSSQYAFGQSHCGQSSINGSSSVVQPTLVTSPFGTLPAAPQSSIGCTETGSPVQYGISSMPVVDKPSPVRKSPLLSARHLSLRQTRLPPRKYQPTEGVQRVPFFYDGDNTPSKPEAAQVIPRRNPRSLVVGPENWPAREQKPCPLMKTSPDENDGVPKNGPLEEQTDFIKASQKMKGVHDDSSLQNDEEYVIPKGAGESAIGYDCDASIDALMPKLCQPDYYTEPHVKELAAKERAEPGFCFRVKDFVVGRLGYGHIKFVGETDVRRLDLESLIHFNNREVIVYTDETKKPPIGQGLNKPAEVTLLNMKYIDKKTGKQYIEGPKVEKYNEMLKKVAEKQGAEFVSYDPIKGEWKFKVRHFS